jgi:hypothetical protein
LASLGGILDQYRYNVAKIRYLLASGSISDLLSDDDDDDNSDADVDFDNLLRRLWSEIPSLGMDKKKKTADGQGNEIRESISVESEKIRLHASNFVCDNEVEVDGYCKMIDAFQSELILAPSNHESPATATSSSDRIIQLSLPPGLRNYGATCYLNSPLQCLAQNLGFVHGLFSWTNVGAKDTMSEVYSSLQSILASMKYDTEKVLYPIELVEALNLETDYQQDPNEVSGNDLLFIFCLNGRYSHVYLRSTMYPKVCSIAL